MATTSIATRLVAVFAAVTASVAIGGTAATAAPAHVEHVRTLVHNADGTVTETSYTPAPGVSAEDLANRLRAKGTANVTVDGHEGVAAAAVAQCSLGTARTWASSATCFVRWAYNGYARPQVYFRDQSSAAWPVGRAVTKWNETSGIDSVYRAWASGCPGGGIHCVPVDSANYGATGWTAQTSRTFNAAATYYASASVKLNDYYGGTETERWGTSCHELGHVLGLNHNTSTSSCLYYQRVGGRSKYPHADDFNLLERYY